MEECIVICALIFFTSEWIYLFRDVRHASARGSRDAKEKCCSGDVQLTTATENGAQPPVLSISVLPNIGLHGPEDPKPLD